MNLEFLGCGGNQFSNIHNLVINYTSFEGEENGGTALELTDTNAQISNCNLLANKDGSIRNLEKQFESIRAIFGAQGIEISTNDTWIGGAMIVNHSNVNIVSSIFENNRALVGGALFVQSSTITIDNTTFTANGIREESFFQFLSIAGSIYQENTYLTLNNSRFGTNSAIIGGCIFTHFGYLNAINSNFSSNAAVYGGVLFSAFAAVTLQGQFTNNKADYGGVSRFYVSAVVITESQFDSNTANFGGAILSFNTSITAQESEFLHNKAVVAGSVIVAASTTIKYFGHLLVIENSAAEFGVMYLSECNIFFEGNSSFINNYGALLAIYSNITFSGYTVFKNNSQPLTLTILNFQDGGALSLFQCNVVFDRECKFEENWAANGGALHSVESELYVNGNLTIQFNIARISGGGIYLSQSELNCQEKGILNIFGNIATNSGGGIHAIRSTVLSTSSDHTNVRFVNNSANEGGGIYLETNAKLYVHKLSHFNSDNKAVHFVGNNANYGGAIYVNDYTNSAACTDKSSECFFRVVYNSYIIIVPNIPTIVFAHNQANSSGSTLYGGLLDRCIVSPFAKVNIYAINAYKLDISGVTYFKDVSIETNSSSISSLPTRVCYCNNHQPNCSYQPAKPIMVKKGHSFSLSLAAIDQIGNPVSAVIHSILSFNSSGLAEGQLTRSIPGGCTELTFNILSPHDNEDLGLYAFNGPCNDAELSTLHQQILFLPCTCPIGFQPSKVNSYNNCTCECHEDLSQHVTCDPLTEMLMKQPQSNVWVSYVNGTDFIGYLVFPNCPYDYCNPFSIPIDLNTDKGADKQCAFNRSRLLCGSCQSALSLSLGSPHCLVCPSYWPAVFLSITIAAVLSCVLLLAVLMALNMTVAIGTLNGLIFYINIIAVNKSVFLPSGDSSFVTVLVSLMNLELGIKTCYFPGLDAYIKTWIQLCFVAAYMIFLIAFTVVILSSLPSRCTNFIQKKHGVETFSTLILLSYVKLLEIIFTALSLSVIDYPDGSSLKVWRPDATVKYLQGKHIILFITALLLLLIGLVYSSLLFFWQWFIYLPSWKVLCFTRNEKIQAFVETYQTPYSSKHRYWTGMLLLVRTVQYLITAANVSNVPQITLISILFTVGFVLSLKACIGRLYRKWPIDILETMFYFNLLALSFFAWYYINREEEYKPIAYISILISFILLIAIILYHMSKYTTLFSRCKQVYDRVGNMLTISAANRPKNESTCTQLDETLDMKIYNED